MLYRVDTGGSEPPDPQRDAIVKMCLEGDKVYGLKLIIIRCGGVARNALKLEVV